MRKILTVLFTIGMTIFLSIGIMNCKTIKPYEREFLSDPIMSLEGDIPEEAFESHWIETLEAGRTTANTSGGGCACN